MITATKPSYLIKWASRVPKDIAVFLENMRTTVPGHFRHSYSSDVYKPSESWGLIQSILAVKILAILNRQELWRKFDSNAIAAAILAFEKESGEITEPLMYNYDFIAALKSTLCKYVRKGTAHDNKNTAMTRSAYNALTILGYKPRNHYKIMDYSETTVRNYVSKLAWDNPWSAGSQFNHLLFFLNAEREIFRMPEPLYSNCIEAAIDALRSHFDEHAGAWKTAAILDENKKINGIMKLCMGLKIINKLEFFKQPARIIDECLSLKTGSHACDFFNLLYVLHAMSSLESHRKRLVEDKCIEMLEILRQYYWEDTKGFSFYKGRAESHYYGFRFARGNPEPDLHGTTMYLWALALINDICGLAIRIYAPVT